MAGNVLEWTSGIMFGKEARGGGWDNKAWYARASARKGYDPTSKNTDIGFRCAQEVSP